MKTNQTLEPVTLSDGTPGARITDGSSEGMAREQGETKVVAAVPTGSLPVFDAESFAGWLAHMALLNSQLAVSARERGCLMDARKLEAYASAYTTAERKCRQQMEEANPRQPEENTKVTQMHSEDGASNLPSA